MFINSSLDGEYAPKIQQFRHPPKFTAKINVKINVMELPSELLPVERLLLEIQLDFFCAAFEALLEVGHIIIGYDHVSFAGTFPYAVIIIISRPD